MKKLTQTEFLADAKSKGVPEFTARTIYRWVADGETPSGFLWAVLSNDLMSAMGKADLSNRPAIYDICIFLFNSTPSECHGLGYGGTSWKSWEGWDAEEVDGAKAAKALAGDCSKVLGAPGVSR